MVLDLVVERTIEPGKDPLEGAFSARDVVRGVELSPRPPRFLILSDHRVLLVVWSKNPAIIPTVSELVGKGENQRAKDPHEDPRMGAGVNSDRSQQPHI